MWRGRRVKGLFGLRGGEGEGDDRAVKEEEEEEESKLRGKEES